MASCNFRYPLTRYERVTAVEWSLCAAKNSSCSKMNCPSDLKEMCGNDGVTYDNACLLRDEESDSVYSRLINSCKLDNIIFENQKM